MIPIELCEVMPGQIMRKQIPPDMTTEIVEFSKMTPAQRLSSIKAGLDVREITILLLYAPQMFFSGLTIWTK